MGGAPRVELKRAGQVGLLGLVMVAAIWLLDRDPPPRDPPPQRPAAATPKPAPARPLRAIAPVPVTHRLEGKVIDSDGRALAGALVVLTAGEPRTTETGADGRFSFDQLAAAAYTAFASSGDLVAEPIAWVVDGKQRPLVLRLARGGSATVKVVDDDDHPVAGATVRVDAASWPSVDAMVAAARTDADGKVTLGPLPLGDLAVQCDAPGYAPSWTSVEVHSSGAHDESIIVVERGSRVAGRVVDERRHPIAHARVEVTAGGWTRHGADTTTDEHGEFVIPGLARGSYTWAVTDDQHVFKQLTLLDVGRRPIEGVELVMRDAAVITGTVCDSQGAPVPLASVWAEGLFGSHARATADAQGAFELRQVWRGPVAVSAATADALSRSKNVDLTRIPRATTELVLESIEVVAPAGAIEGIVVDDQGRPLAGISITARPDWAHLPPGLKQPVGERSTISGEDGTFLLDRLADVLYYLDARRSNTALWFPASRRNFAHPGDHDVRVELPPDGALVGRLELEGGGAPQNAYVAIDGLGAKASADGSFVIHDIAPGTYSITCYGDDVTTFTRADVRIAAGETTDLETLKISRDRTLVGRVVDPVGAPVRDARVDVGVIRPFEVEEDGTISGGFKIYRSATSTRDGAFRVLHVPVKPMLVITSHPDHGLTAPMAIAPSAQLRDDPPPVTIALPARR